MVNVKVRIERVMKSNDKVKMVMRSKHDHQVVTDRAVVGE